jgi:hypothetical protein
MTPMEYDLETVRNHSRWLAHGEGGGCTQLDLRKGGTTIRSFHSDVASLIEAVTAHPQYATNIGVNPRPAHWAPGGFRECGADSIERVTAVRIDIDCCRPMALATAELIRVEFEVDARRRTEAGRPTLDLPPMAVTIAARCAPETPGLLAGIEEHKAILRRAVDAACQAEDIQLRPELLDRLVTYVNRVAASQPTTEAEYQLAIDAGKKLSDWAKAQGWGAPLVIGSGNGCHVWFAVAAIRLDANSREAIHLACAELERLCRLEIEREGSPLRVDRWGGLAAVTRLAGCPNHKGNATEDRPHRLSRIVQGAKRSDGAALAQWLRSEGAAIHRQRQEERASAEAERKARLAANPRLDGTGLRNLDKRIDGAVEGFIEKHPLSGVGHDEMLSNLLRLARMLSWELDLPDAESRFRALVKAHCDADHWTPRQFEAELAKALRLANGAQGARDARCALIERWAAEDERDASARHSARRRETRERIVAVGAASKIDVEGGGDGGLKLTDLGNAERFVKRFGDRVRYCPPRKSWLVWDSRRWAWDDTGEVMRLAKKTARASMARPRTAPAKRRLEPSRNTPPTARRWPACRRWSRLLRARRASP